MGLSDPGRLGGIIQAEVERNPAKSVTTDKPPSVDKRRMEERRRSRQTVRKSGGGARQGRRHCWWRICVCSRMALISCSVPLAELRKQIAIGVDQADRGQMQVFNEKVSARVRVRGRKPLAADDRSDRA